MVGATHKSRIVLLITVALVALSSDIPAADKSFNRDYGGFNDPSCWSTWGAPAATDDVYIGNLAGVDNGTAYLTGHVNIANLNVTSGMTLSGTYDHDDYWRINVAGETYVSGYNTEGAFGYRSTIEVFDTPGSGADFVTGALTVYNDGSLAMAGGHARVNGLARFDNAILSGSGLFESNAVGDVGLEMNGQIVVNRQLTIRQLGSGKIDLDGSTSGQDTIHLWNRTIDGAFAQLTVEGDLHDSYDDNIILGANNVLSMQDTDWTMGPGATLNFHRGENDLSDPGTLMGGKLTFQGAIRFDDYSEFNGDAAAGEIWNRIDLAPSARAVLGEGDQLEFQNLTTVQGGNYQVAAGAVLAFNGGTIIHGGTFSTQGSGSSQGVVEFNSPTAWRGNVTIHGYARQSGSAAVEAPTTIDAERFDLDGTGSPTWTLNAPLTVNAGALDDPADPYVNRVTSDFVVNSGSLVDPTFLEVNLPGNQSWTMDGDMTLIGAASPFSVSTLRGSPVTVTGTMNVVRTNVMEARLNLSGGGIGIASGGKLQLAGGTPEAPNTIYSGSVQGPGALGATAGQSLVGYGLIGAAIDFDGNAELRARGGTLTLSGAIQDVGRIGTADATGTLIVNSPWNSSVAERVELLGGQLKGAALTNGGRVEGHGLLAMSQLINSGELAAVGGTLTIALPGSPTGPDLDGATEQGRLRAEQGDLHIVDSLTEPFHGTASVAAGRTLTFDNGWTNLGALQLSGLAQAPARVGGASTQHLGGSVEVDGLAQFTARTNFMSDGRLSFAIAGVDAIEQHGVLQIANHATLNGQLAIELAAGFVPQPGDLFRVLEFATRSGTFSDTTGLTFGVEGGAFLHPLYRADHLLLYRPLMGDANFDGLVSGADYTLWADHFGGSASWSGGDFNGDGQVTGADYTLWADHFGESVSLQAVAVPEPSAVWLALFGFLGGLGLWGRGALRDG